MWPAAYQRVARQVRLRPAPTLVDEGPDWRCGAVMPRASSHPACCIDDIARGVAFVAKKQ